MGDNIMILHGGHVKASGDSLFLKNNYGKGYQLLLVFNKEFIPEIQNIIRHYLPASSLAGNDAISTGYLSINIAKGDVQGLPRLFTWIESSSRAKCILK